MLTTEFPRSSIMTTLKTLNDGNGADKVCDKYEKIVLEEFKDNLIGVIMGVPYGGDVERLAKIWGEKGKIYGYDTFEGHPKQLSADVNSFEATCMDFWYSVLGTEKLKIEYQRAELDKMGLTNTFLVKGLINKDSCKDLDHINYAFIDLDILASMKSGYEAVKDKLVEGGILILHDINNIQTLIPWYEKEIKKDPMWEVVEEYNSLTGVLRKKHGNH
jgi:hypothetical protein